MLLLLLLNLRTKLTDELLAANKHSREGEGEGEVEGVEGVERVEEESTSDEQQSSER